MRYELLSGTRLSIVLVLFVLTALHPPQIFVDQEMVVEHPPQFTVSANGYTDHEPINIDPYNLPNSSFAYQGWPGSGTPEDPYIIEYLRITHYSDCIHVIGTEEYFVIRHCYFVSSANGRTVLLSSVLNGVVEDCIIYGGIDIFGSKSCVLKSNTILDADYGIHADDLKNCGISNNTITSCNRGIDIYDSRYISISENLVESCIEDAVYVRDTIGCVVCNNTVLDSPNGIQLIDSPISEIVHNKVLNQEFVGIRLTYHSGHSNILDNQILDTDRMAIDVSMSNRVEIKGNEIKSAQIGLSIWDCKYSTIRKNEFTDCTDYGTRIQMSPQTVIEKNRYVNNGYCSISISHDCSAINNTVTRSIIGLELSVDSHRSELSFNRISNCFETGISTQYGYDHLLFNNTISDCKKSALRLMYSTRVVIINNSMTNCGVKVVGSEIQHWDHSFLSNTVDSKPFGYFRNINNSIIDLSGFSQVILYDSSDVELKNGLFANTPFGVDVAYTNSSKVSNCTFYANEYGVELSYSKACTVTNNTFTNCGLVLTGEIMTHWKHSIVHNIVNSKPLGSFQDFKNITLDAEEYGQLILVNCTNVEIRDGVIANASCGLQMTNSTDCALRNLTISGSSKCGVLVFSSSEISIVESSLFDNLEGILAINAERCFMRNNTVLRSTETGIHMGMESSLNQIYWNVIGKSGRRNAHDDGFANQWDDGQSVGNFWDDYIGTGFYFIYTEFFDSSGRYVIIDRFPNGTAGDSIPPIIDPVEDIEFVLGTSGYSIIWNVSDTNPSDYQIFRNGTLVESQQWQSGIIVVVLDSLEVGLYNFTLIITDLGLNYAINSVIVRVIPHAPSTTAHLTLVFVFTASVSVATLALIFVYRRHFYDNQSKGSGAPAGIRTRRIIYESMNSI